MPQPSVLSTSLQRLTSLGLLPLCRWWPQSPLPEICMDHNEGSGVCIFPSFGKPIKFTMLLYSKGVRTCQAFLWSQCDMSQHDILQAQGLFLKRIWIQKRYGVLWTFLLVYSFEKVKSYCCNSWNRATSILTLEIHYLEYFFTSLFKFLTNK